MDDEALFVVYALAEFSVAQEEGHPVLIKSGSRSDELPDISVNPDFQKFAASLPIPAELWPKLVSHPIDWIPSPDPGAPTLVVFLDTHDNFGENLAIAADQVHLRRYTDLFGRESINNGDYPAEKNKLLEEKFMMASHKLLEARSGIVEEIDNSLDPYLPIAISEQLSVKALISVSNEIASKCQSPSFEVRKSAVNDLAYQAVLKDKILKNRGYLDGFPYDVINCLYPGLFTYVGYEDPFIGSWHHALDNAPRSQAVKAWFVKLVARSEMALANMIRMARERGKNLAVMGMGKSHYPSLREFAAGLPPGESANIIFLKTPEEENVDMPELNQFRWQSP